MTRPVISIQAAIGPGTPPSNTFIIGSSLIGGTDVIAGTQIVGLGTWEELNDRCSRIAIRRGRQRLLERYPAGSMSAELDNSDGAFDRWRTTGPYTDGGVSNVAADRAIKVTATYEGSSFPLFYGYTNDWPAAPGFPEGGWSRVSASDAFRFLAKIELDAVAAEGAGDATGARIARFLDAMDWPTPLRELDTGNATHQATTFGGKVLDLAQLAVDSERGGLFMGPDNKVVFHEQLRRYTDGRSKSVLWAFGDGAGELGVEDFDVSNDNDLKRNDVAVSRVGGSTVSLMTDEAATYPHLRASYRRSDLTLEDDTQVARYASSIVRLFGDTTSRIDSITLNPDADPDLFEFILNARYGDRVSVNLTAPDGERWQGDYFVEGLDHDIPVLESGSQWRTKVYLDDASKVPTNPFIIGQSLIGGTDVITP